MLSICSAFHIVIKFQAMKPIPGFWSKLKKPFFVLAPMANVTDAAFRLIIAKYGKPDAFWTEFVSADGLVSEGKKKLLTDLKYSKAEKPIVAQLFSANPEKMEKAAELVVKLGFDGLDINMGCPDRTVVRQGAGGALIKNKELAVKIIEAAKRGVKGKIPVSVKTRIGYSTNELKEWLPLILKTEPAAVTIHARTVKELSRVPARWVHVSEAVKIRDKVKSKTLIIGNGDVTDLAMAKKLAKQTGADGVMIGRGIFGNPWLFSNKQKMPMPREKLKALVEHTKLFEKMFKDKKRFDVMKKHFKAYVNGFPGAKELRAELMNTAKAGEVEKFIRSYLIS
jgi:nifR3 family TIM-barrel protein